MNEPERIVAVRYPELYRRCRDFLIEAIGLLRTQFGADPQWIKRSVPSIIRVDEAGSTIDLVEKSFPRQNIGIFQAEFRSLTSAVSALDELEKMGVKDKFPLPFGDLFVSYLFPIITKFVETNKKLVFDQQQFQAVYEEIEAFIAADRCRVCTYHELAFLKGDIPRVPLSDTHSIVRLDSTRVVHLWEQMTDPDRFGTLNAIAGPPGVSFPLSIGSYVLEGAIEFAKHDANKLGVLIESERARSEISLRLAGIGRGSIRYLTYDHLGYFPTFFRLGMPPQIAIGAFENDLGQGLVALLSDRWRRAYETATEIEQRSSTLQPALRIACSRYVSSFQKINQADRLLDLVIGLEALLTKENDAIAYRLPLRGAILLGDEPAKRIECFEVLKAAYTQRSRLAHGNDELEVEIKVGSSKVPVKEFLAMVEQNLSGSIWAFLDAGGLQKDQLLSRIDNAVLTQSRDQVRSTKG